MQEVGVGVPTDACRRWDSGDHPIAGAHQSGIASNCMSPAEFKTEPHTCSTPVWNAAFGAGRHARSNARINVARVWQGWMSASTQPRAAP